VEAQKAISMFNGFTLNSRDLTVNLARPREERRGFDNRGGGGGRGGFDNRGGGGGGGRGKSRRGGGGGTRRY
jgi:hypothetical protein